MSATKGFAISAVLFDLDGTLLDTAEDLAVAANAMLAELARPPRHIDEIRRFVGKGIPHLVDRCLNDGATSAHADEVARGIEAFRRHYADVNGVHSRPYAGVVETLRILRARGLPLACVTNKPEAFTLPLLERTGLQGYFAAVVSGDTLAVKKPDPAMLHHACRMLDVPPMHALMIGDSANDALAARAAGIPVFLVTYGYSEGVPVDSIECDGLLSNATEVLALVAAR